jgi:hypothetical protein
MSRCQYSDVWLTRDADQNAVGDWFRDGLGNVPVVGGIVGAFVPDTLTQNVVRQCQGKVHDHTSGYTVEQILIVILIALIGVYILVRK